jgi:Caspase recruitment domain
MAADMAVDCLRTVDCQCTMKDQYKLLVRSIDVTDELVNYLQNIEALRPHIARIEAAVTPKEKAGVLLKVLMGMEAQNFAAIEDEFLDALRLSGQYHIADELTADVEGDLPMSEKNLERMNAKADELQRFIDAFGGLLPRLLSTGVFTENDYRRVRDKLPRNMDEAAEDILNILRRKSNYAFTKFKEALNITGQSHVVYILTDGRKGQPPLCDTSREALSRNRKTLVKKMEPMCGLLDELESNGSFSANDRHRATGCGKIILYINSTILDIIVRKSQQAFDDFIKALDKTCQKHISALIKLEPVLMMELEPKKTAEPTNAASASVAPQTPDRNFELDIVAVVNNSSDTIDDSLSNSGVKIHAEQKCIKLYFSNLTLESLNELQQLHETKCLEAAVTKICRSVLDKWGFHSITLHADQQEFDRVRQELTSLESAQLMTDAHSEALLSTVSKLSATMNVTESLLQRLSMCHRRKMAVDMNESNEKKVRVLLEITSRRPDSAFDELVNALTATGQGEAANILLTAAAGFNYTGNESQVHPKTEILVQEPADCTGPIDTGII